MLSNGKRINKKELRAIRKRVLRNLTKPEQKKVRKVVEQTICLLRAMACGQGDACIEVADAGAGGGWQWGKWTCDWLRDGILGKSGSQYSPTALRDSIMAMLAENHWMLGKHVLRGKWRYKGEDGDE